MKKIGWRWGAEREREVPERGTERGSGVTEIGLSGERKFCRSRSAHMLCSGEAINADKTNKKLQAMLRKAIRLNYLHPRKLVDLSHTEKSHNPPKGISETEFDI